MEKKSKKISEATNLLLNKKLIAEEHFTKLQNALTYENLHNSRVAFRRLLIVINLLSRYLNLKEQKTIFKIIKLFIKFTEKLSNTQTSIKIINKYDKQFMLFEFGKYLQKREIKYQSLVKENIDKWPWNKSKLGIEKLIKILNQKGQDADTFLIEDYIQQNKIEIKKIHQNYTQVNINNIQSIHHLRISLRRLRYLNEAVKSFYGELSSHSIATCKTLQTLIGDLHDITIFANNFSACIYKQKSLKQNETKKLDLFITSRSKEIKELFLSNIDNFKIENFQQVDFISQPAQKNIRHKKTLFQLILVRHATAIDRNTPGVKYDELRPLTNKGRRQALYAGRTLSLFVKNPILWTSPAVRAFETAIIASRELGVSPTIVKELSPETSLADITLAISKFAGPDKTLIIVGHEPILSELISNYIFGSRLPQLCLKKAGIANITFSHENSHKNAKFNWIISPELAKKILRNN